MQKVRRPGGARVGGYPGAAVIEQQLAGGPAVRRVGLRGVDRIPVREGATVHDAAGQTIGRVTSGTIGPSVDAPIAMAYLAINHAAPDTEVFAEVRGKRVAMRLAAMPFAPHRYHR
jgi:aminomethyltransferase